MEIQYRSHIKDRNCVTFIAIINPVPNISMKGGLYENLIVNMLLSKGYLLHFYKPKENDQEIEFVISKDAEIISIEVKSRNGRTESLNSFIEEYKPQIAYKFIDGNFGKIDNKVTLPHFMAMYL